MEYSVFDLIRALLKKWYVIVLIMALISGASVFTAQASYQKALADYEAYTTETVPLEETGTLSATVNYTYALADFSKYTEEARNKMAFINAFCHSMGAPDSQLTVEDYANEAYATYTGALSQLPTDSRITTAVQQGVTDLGYMEPPVLDEQGNLIDPDTTLTVANHLTVTPVNKGQVILTVSGVTETAARDILKFYIQNLTDVAKTAYSIKIQAEEPTVSFAPDPVQYTQSAQFAQMVMEKPEQAPILVKTVGTAAMYAFVLGCFCVLLYTFIKDSRRQAAGSAGAGSHE